MQTWCCDKKKKKKEEERSIPPSKVDSHHTNSHWVWNSMVVVLIRLVTIVASRFVAIFSLSLVPHRIGAVVCCPLCSIAQQRHGEMLMPFVLMTMIRVNLLRACIIKCCRDKCVILWLFFFNNKKRSASKIHSVNRKKKARIQAIHYVSMDLIKILIDAYRFHMLFWIYFFSSSFVEHHRAAVYNRSSRPNISSKLCRFRLYFFLFTSQ